MWEWLKDNGIGVISYKEKTIVYPSHFRKAGLEKWLGK